MISRAQVARSRKILVCSGNMPIYGVRAEALCCDGVMSAILSKTGRQGAKVRSPPVKYTVRSPLMVIEAGQLFA